MTLDPTYGVSPNAITPENRILRRHSGEFYPPNAKLRLPVYPAKPTWEPSRRGSGLPWPELTNDLLKNEIAALEVVKAGAASANQS